MDRTALPSTDVLSEFHIAPPDYLMWIDSVAHELNEGISAMLETRGRELVMRDVREVLVGDDGAGATALRDRATALELEPLGSILREVLP